MNCSCFSDVAFNSSSEASAEEITAESVASKPTQSSGKVSALKFNAATEGPNYESGIESGRESFGDSDAVKWAAEGPKYDSCNESGYDSGYESPSVLGLATEGRDVDTIDDYKLSATEGRDVDNSDDYKLTVKYNFEVGQGVIHAHGNFAVVLNKFPTDQQPTYTIGFFESTDTKIVTAKVVAEDDLQEKTTYIVSGIDITNTKYTKNNLAEAAEKKEIVISGKKFVVSAKLKKAQMVDSAMETIEDEDLKDLKDAILADRDFFHKHVSQDFTPFRKAG